MLELPRLSVVSSGERDREMDPYTRTVRGLSGVLIVVSYFVEVVLVQLTDEAGEVAVLEVFR